MFEPSFIVLISLAFVFYLHIFWYNTPRKTLFACTIIVVVVAALNALATEYGLYGLYKLLLPRNASDMELAKHFLGYFNFKIKWGRTIGGGVEELFRSSILIFWVYIFFKLIQKNSSKKYKESFLEDHIQGLAFIYGAYESFQIINTEKMWGVLENTYKNGVADGLHLLRFSEDQRLGAISTIVLVWVFITRYYLHLMHLRFSVLSLYHKKYVFYILSIFAHLGVSAIFTWFSYGRKFETTPEILLTLLAAQTIAILIMWYVVNTYVRPNRPELPNTTNLPPQNTM